MTRAVAESKAAFEVVLTRLFDAPPERVFEAWTTPARLRQWFGPKGFSLYACDVDFRLGGALRVGMRGPDGTDYPAMEGVYRELVPPERIVWTNGFPGGSGAEQVLTVVTFIDQGGETELTVRQSFAALTPATEPMARGSKQGWTETLDRLGEQVERGTSV